MTNVALRKLVAGSLILISTQAIGAYPDKAITVVVPFPPGGNSPADFMAFQAAEAARWKQVIEVGKIKVD